MSHTSRNALNTSQVEVAICGNPNCGKTTIFNAITGLRQRVGNYPGVTVEKIFGQFRIDEYPGKEFTLVDIPGSYSLSAYSPDEYIAARALFGNVAGSRLPDVIVCVIDATNLERGLYLLFQVLQIGRPVVIGLNMVDLTRRKGININARKLSSMLGGIPVVPMIGSRGKGVRRLKREIGRLANNLQSEGEPSVDLLNVNDPAVDKAVEYLDSSSQVKDRNRAELLRVLFDAAGPAERDFVSAEGAATIDHLNELRKGLIDKFGSLTAAETQPYTRRAAEIADTVVKAGRTPPKSYSSRIDRFLLHPVLGPILLIMLMTLMFQSIFSWAEPLMDLVDTVFSGLAEMVEGAMVPGPLQSLLAHGVIGGVGSVLIFLPQIMILFLFISILEDSGYMPRAAFLVDRAFAWCGLSGKSFIPMLSSFACAVPGILATRTIEDRKLRLITIMVAPLMACSARLPVYTIMIAAFIPHKQILGIFNAQGLVLTALYFLGIVVAVLVSFVLKKTLLKTERGTFIMDMPSYKWPSPSSIIIRVFNRAKSFVLRAGTIILAITIIIWALGYYPHSESITQEYDSRRTTLAESSDRALDGSMEAMTEATADDVNRIRVLADLRERLSGIGDESDLVSATEQMQAEYVEYPDLVDLAARHRGLQLQQETAAVTLENEAAGAHLRDSYFARVGRLVEPVFRPLGWDWKITMAVLSSFPAREVVIATLGTTFNLGANPDETASSLVEKMRQASWDRGELAGRSLFSPAVALSIMVFFALSCQCGATVVTIRQEAGSWLYSILVFGYMTVLAYVGALGVYQLFSRMGF